MNLNSPEAPAIWNEAQDVSYLNLKVGMKLVVDDGFDCMEPWSVVEVKHDVHGAGTKAEWYVGCKPAAESPGEISLPGIHFLDGQRDFKTDTLIGMRLVQGDEVKPEPRPEPILTREGRKVPEYA